MLVEFVSLTYYSVMLNFEFVSIFHSSLSIESQHYDWIVIRIYLLHFSLLVGIFLLSLHRGLYAYHELRIQGRYTHICNQNKNKGFILSDALYMFFLMIFLEMHHLLQLWILNLFRYFYLYSCHIQHLDHPQPHCFGHNCIFMYFCQWVDCELIVNNC